MDCLTDFVPVNVERDDSSMLNNFEIQDNEQQSTATRTPLTKNPQEMRQIDDLLWISFWQWLAASRSALEQLIQGWLPTMSGEISVDFCEWFDLVIWIPIFLPIYCNRESISDPPKRVSPHHGLWHQEKISSDSPFWKAKFNIRSVNAPPRHGPWANGWMEWYYVETIGS